MGVLRYKTYGGNVGSKNQGRVSTLSYPVATQGILKHIRRQIERWLPTGRRQVADFSPVDWEP